MAGPPTEDEGQLTFIFTGEGMPTGGACTLGFSWSILGIGEYMDQIGPSIVDVVEATMSDVQVLEKVVVKQGPVADGFTADFAFGTQGGQGSGAPPQSTGLVRKVCAGVTARKQGRMFWPAGSDDSVFSSGLLNPATVNSWDDVFEELRDAMVGAQGGPLVFPAAGGTREVIGFQTQPRSATLKARNRR